MYSCSVFTSSILVKLYLIDKMSDQDATDGSDGCEVILALDYAVDDELKEAEEEEEEIVVRIQIRFVELSFLKFNSLNRMKRWKRKRLRKNKWWRRVSSWQVDVGYLRVAWKSSLKIANWILENDLMARNGIVKMFHKFK